ncbi:MAG: TonB-dependent receptor [Bacteroidota bacterium]|nr:TonB-dependent receptor [Bacteroidota bacterium]
MKNIRIAISIILLMLSKTSFCDDDAAGKVSMSGYIKDAKNGEDIIGATVYVKELKTGATTNSYGFYSVTLPKGTYNILISYIGYKSIENQIVINENITQNFMLQVESITTDEVLVSAHPKDENVNNIQMSMNRLTVDQMKKVPVMFGEIDIIKNIQQLPGVQSVGEGSSAFFVRGGSSDQNLILLDEAPVYNASHLAGIFSVFNGDAIKSADIYKGGIPAQFGGRLSSVVDIRTRDGNSQKLSGTASIGLLSSKATLEGPIIRDKGSFIVSARRSYFDVFLKASSDKDIKNTTLYFYDINAKLNYQLGKRDRIYLSGYYGQDVFKSGNFGLSWGNATTSLRWSHVFNNRLFMNTSGIFSDFNYSLGLTSGVQAFEWVANIQEQSLKQDYSYLLNINNELKFGVQICNKSFQPGVITPKSDNSIFREVKMPLNNALEYALYISNEQKIWNRLHLQYGLRFTTFQNNGNTTYIYANNNISSKNNITDTISNNYYQVDKTYFGLEPRLGVKFNVDEKSSIKASYNHTYQYIHQLSNSASPLPITMWVPSSRYIAPQTSDQIALGYFHNLLDNTIECSLEGYYKWLNNTIDFKDNAQLLMNPAIETEVLRGTGYSYGAELMVKKSSGKFTWTAAYTLSWTKLKIPGINNGNEYFASWDRRHNINASLFYEINKRWSVGTSWMYGSGRPITLPAGKYTFEQTSVLIYNERNGERTPDFHRLDLSVNLKSKVKPNRKWSSEWNFSIYNVYNRKNPFSVYTRNEEVPNPENSNKTITTNNKQIVMLWLFPIVPSVTYTFNF